MAHLTLSQKLKATREACEADLLTFIETVAPHRMLGHVHEDLINWWQREDKALNDLALLPRGHQKSAMIAFRAAHRLTRMPWETIMYTSATASLAQLQLFDIKQIISSKRYLRLWPEMIHVEEAKRAQWNKDAIIVDHPKRANEFVRDPSITAIGIGATTTGKHAGLIIMDDLVVPENAYTEEGRRSVAAAYSQFASIANPGAPKWVVGTRYFPADLYADLMAMEASEYDEDGELVKKWRLYDVFSRVVETDGEFLWPKQLRRDGMSFGFNANVLAGIKAEYLDKTQFYAQYYNDPNDPSNDRVDRSNFQYFDREKLRYENGFWALGDKRLNIMASMDFAFSTSTKADWTAIAVVGVDPEGYYYILDLERFKTNRISEYFAHFEPLYNKWMFRKVRMEVTSGQAVIVRDLKENYIQPNGLALSIEEHRPTTNKDERLAAILYPRYDNKQVYHYRGGNIQPYEEELVAAKSRHDDMKDVVMGAVDSLKPPPKAIARRRKDNIVYNTRFGGSRYRG